MDAIARRALPALERALDVHNSIVIDGLYSFSEYRTLQARFAGRMVVIAVACARRTRYKRLAERPERPLTAEQAEQRDHQEIEKIEKGGPIAIADYTLLNDGAPDDLLAALDHLLDDLAVTP